MRELYVVLDKKTRDATGGWSYREYEKIVCVTDDAELGKSLGDRCVAIPFVTAGQMEDQVEEREM